LKGAETLSPHRTALKQRASSALYSFINTPLLPRSGFVHHPRQTSEQLPAHLAERPHSGDGNVGWIDRLGRNAVVAAA
jgi:hypothetical protein